MTAVFVYLLALKNILYRTHVIHDCQSCSEKANAQPRKSVYLGMLGQVQHFNDMIDAGHVYRGVEYVFCVAYPVHGDGKATKAWDLKGKGGRRGR